MAAYKSCFDDRPRANEDVIGDFERVVGELSAFVSVSFILSSL
jgi:hypothetical protein